MYELQFATKISKIDATFLISYSMKDIQGDTYCFMDERIWTFKAVK